MKGELRGSFVIAMHFSKLHAADVIVVIVWNYVVVVVVVEQILYLIMVIRRKRRNIYRCAGEYEV